MMEIEHLITFFNVFCVLNPSIYRISQTLVNLDSKYMLSLEIEIY